uniref:TSA: Wollemia nobilis Ref_Wollemi_Transcript_17293_800 transcribed RNA sequence n=1 Tax=Wollemia nobilis TaxID=56998 RepID=A0A0C9S2W4_9CONI
MADTQKQRQFLFWACFLQAFLLIVGSQSSFVRPQESPLRLSVQLEEEGMCSDQYVVKIKTSCSAFAGTDDRISIAFGDAFGNQVYVARLDDPTVDTFERCSTDTFTILGPCVYKVCYLYLMRSGSDAWKPEWVKVYYGRGQSATFYYDMFIPDGVWYGFDLCSILTLARPHNSSLTI